MKIITLTRKELKGKNIRDFEDGTVIHVENYMVFINGLHTYAERYDRPLIPLKENQMPNYIHDIVF